MQNSYLAHHGIKGQKWGVRRFQNEDGSLTEAGRLHIGLNKKGEITLTREKVDKNRVKKFIAKSLITAGAIAASTYISKHPELITEGLKFMHSKKAVDVDDDFMDGPKIWDDKLGRYLSDEEVDEILSKNKK